MFLYKFSIKLSLYQQLTGLKGDDIAGVAGSLSDAEALVSLKDFLNRLQLFVMLCRG